MMVDEHPLTWHKFKQMNRVTRQKKLESVGKTVLMATAVFQQTCDMLSFHNQLADLVWLLQNGYAQSKTSSTGSQWQHQTLAAQLTDSLIFQHLATQPLNAPAQTPEALLKTLHDILPIDADGLSRYLAHLNGYTQYQWLLAHLSEHPPQNMAALMLEFLAYAHHQADVPYGRTNLLRHLLPTYFVERRTGQLTPRQDLGDLRRSGRPLPKPSTTHHPLVPDSDTLQRFLAKLLNYEPIRPYPAAALFNLIPTWLTFLQARQLLAADEASTALADLVSLKPDLLTYFETFEGDDGLSTAIHAFANLPKA